MFRSFASLFATVPLCAVLATAGLGCARTSPEPSEDEITERVHQRVEMVLDRIEATDDQRQRLAPLEDRLVEQISALRAGATEAHELAAELWLSDDPDPAQAHALVDQRLDVARDAAHELTDLVLDLHQVLTPEQRQAVLERIRERRSHFGARLQVR